MSIGTITEAKIREIFKDEFERHYRETHHTFSIEGGSLDGGVLGGVGVLVPEDVSVVVVGVVGVVTIVGVVSTVVVVVCTGV